MALLAICLQADLDLVIQFDDYMHKFSSSDSKVHSSPIRPPITLYDYRAR